MNYYIPFIMMFLLIGTISNAQQILDSGLNSPLNLTSKTLKDSLIKEDYKTYLYVNENDSTFTYSLDVLFEDNKHRKIYITVTKKGILNNIYVSENYFDFYNWILKQKVNQIEDFKYNFFE